MSENTNNSQPPEPAPSSEPTRAPAVHSDQLWGGPQWIHNAGSEPVFVETQSAYWDLINRAGLRMKHQQESKTGDQRDPVQEQPEPEPIVRPISQQEAQIYGAMRAFQIQYGLLETIWCTDCFQRHRHHGCRGRVSPKEVSLECRCGLAVYKPPTGTTDTVLSKIANSAKTLNDVTEGSIQMPFGNKILPAAVMNDIEADLFRQWIRALQRRAKEPRLFHQACFAGSVLDEDNALAISVGNNDITLVCECRILFHRRVRIESGSKPS